MDSVTLAGEEAQQAIIVDDEPTQNAQDEPMSEENEEEPKVRKCLGNNCKEMLPKGIYFCKSCKGIKDRTRLSGSEDKAYARKGGHGHKLNNAPTVCEHSSDAAPNWNASGRPCVRRF